VALAGVRRVWFAASPYSSAHGLQDPEEVPPQDRVRLIHHHGRANSVVVRIPPARRAPVVIRRVREWVRGKVRFRLLPADRRVRVDQRAAPGSLTSPGKKKGR